MGIFSGTYHFNDKPRSASRWHVFGKKRLSDPNWTYLPFLECVSLEHASAPDVGQAQFKSYYGVQLKGSHNINFWDFYYPYTVNGSFLLVSGQNSFFSSGPVNPLGIYQIKNETVEQLSTGGEFPGGIQTFTGLELSSVLDRIFIDFSVVKNNHDAMMTVPELFVFNENLISSNATTGNRSASKSGDSYHFDLQPNNHQGAWSAYDILEYIFVYFLNTGENSVRWTLDGDGADILKNLYVKLDPSGKSVFNILDELINKNYGLGFGISFNLNFNAPIIWVYSNQPPGIFGNSTRGTYRILNLEDRGLVENSLSFDEGSVYDEITVRGGPIYTTGTFSLFNNNLEPGWQLSDEYNYMTLPGGYPAITIEEMNEEREKEEFKDIYNKFRIPRDWNGVIFSATLPGDLSNSTTQVFPNGFNFFPTLNPYSGFLDFSYKVAPHLWGRGFEQSLPFTDKDRKNKEPFVGIAANKADIDNLSRSGIKYFSIENLSNVELPSGDFSIENDEFGFSTTLLPNYVLGKNRIIMNDPGPGATWAGDGVTQIDMTMMDGDLIKLKYENIFITATINTGNRINLKRNASTNYETKRPKIIDMGDSFNLHLIAPQTIEKIVPNPTEQNYFDLQYIENSYIFKNDINKLRDIMFLALNTFGIPRSICNFTAADPLYNFSIGDYIIADSGKAGVTFIHQNITSIRRSMTESGIHTEVSTSHSDLSFEAIFENMLDHKYSKRQEYATGADSIKKIITPKKGQTPAKSILVVDDFPELPTNRTKNIFLKNSSIHPTNQQVWEGIPGATRWYPTARHCTVNGIPGELGGS